jgi:hypothetical protein
MLKLVVEGKGMDVNFAQNLPNEKQDTQPKCLLQ